MREKKYKTRKNAMNKNKHVSKVQPLDLSWIALQGVSWEPPSVVHKNVPVCVCVNVCRVFFVVVLMQAHQIV